MTQVGSAANSRILFASSSSCTSPGIRAIYVAQGIDSSSEQAELLIGVHGIVDSLYLKDLAKRTFSGVEQLARTLSRQGAELSSSRRLIEQVERQIRNCTEAISRMGLSGFFRAQQSAIAAKRRSATGAR